jgi:hypothetical protein
MNIHELCPNIATDVVMRRALSLLIRHGVILSESRMKLKTIALATTCMSALFAGSAFASGYGPAPFYRPDVGASASQRGQSGQTVSAERQQAFDDATASAFGGVPAGVSAADSRWHKAAGSNIFKGH